MAGELRYRKDLFKGTAEYYDRFRVPYPAALLDDLRARVPLDGESRVLDLACGTGQIAFALASQVGEVVAVDQEPEFVEFGAQKARRLRVGNIRWTAGTAEEVTLDGKFGLVAVGNAFHRLDRDLVTRRLFQHRDAGGCVALLWGGSPWRGERPWQRALDEMLERWMDEVGARNRVPPGWEEQLDADPSERVLARTGFAYEGQFEFSTVERWTVESLTGFVYSTSFLNRVVLGDRVDEFERELRARLLACSPDGAFEQDLTFAYQLARRPA